MIWKGTNKDTLGLHLLLFFIITARWLASSRSTLAPDTSWASSSKRRGRREVDVLGRSHSLVRFQLDERMCTHLLGIKTDDKGWSVDYLPSNADMPLANQDTSVMNALGQAGLEHLCLQPTLQEVFNLQGQHVIQSHAGLVKHTDTDQTTDECISFKETLGVF